MRKSVKILIAGICMIMAISVVPKSVSAKPSVSAEAACVMDVQSGAVLYDKNMNKKEYPASITKIMTALVALENSSLDEEVEYTDNAFINWESGASNIEIVVGEKISMKESLYAVMLASANEACNGIAEHVSGDVGLFVDKMNEKAKEIGCKNTHFQNTNGLWQKDHYTTPYDMALIGREAMKSDVFREIAGTKYYEMSKTNKRKAGYAMLNHHKMLVPGEFPQYGYEYCEGGKTGYTSKCRYTLVTFAKKGDMELVCVVMRVDGSPYQDQNAYTDTTRLFNYCFENYEKTKIQDDAVSAVNEQYLFTNFSPFYSKETSCLYIDENAGIMLPKGVTVDQAEKKIEYYDTATIEPSGRRVIGKISYLYKGKEVGGSNIYFDENDSPTLKDSIDMSKWFVEAVEKAKEEPFPWKKVILVIILIGCILGVSIVCFFKIRSYQIKTANRRRYKKNRRRMHKRDRDFYTKRLR